MISTRFKKGHKTWNKGMKGIHFSPKTEFKKGFTPWNKGKKCPHCTGSNNNRWSGGIYPEHLAIRHSVEMKRLTREALERDNFTCQDCGKRGGKLFVHHIKSFAIYKELRLDINNLITVCGKCHRKRHVKNIK